MAGKTLEEWKSEINWNKSGNADTEYQNESKAPFSTMSLFENKALDGFISGIGTKNYKKQREKYVELQKIIASYKRSWSSLAGPTSGITANIIITIERPLGSFVEKIKKLSEIMGLTSPGFHIGKTFEESGELTGCKNAAETTYTYIIAGIMPRYWKVALIQIPGHFAVVVYDDEIGKGETYVFDPWKTQTPEVYTWESWPFNEFLKSRYSVKKKYEYPVK